MPNMFDKIAGWIYNKKPRNKYLRIAYYSLIGMICIMLMAFLLLIVVVFIGVSLQASPGLLLLLFVPFVGFIVGYFAFGDLGEDNKIDKP